MYYTRSTNAQGGDDYRRVKQNLALLKGSRKRYDELKELHKIVVKTRLRFRTPSKSTLEKIKQKIQQDKVAERQRHIRITLISLGFGVMLVAFLVYLFKYYV